MRYGVVAAGHRLTAQAGSDILEAGGNAFDAAVAAALASCVVEPSLTSLGGGGFLLARPAQVAPMLFDFFIQTPGQCRPISELDFFPIVVDFGDAVQEFHIGLGSAGVPGCPSGLWETHSRLGRLPMTEVALPAIQYAREHLITGFQAGAMQKLSGILKATGPVRKLYCQDGGELKEAGHKLRLDQLADTLEYLAGHGVDEFYRGEIGANLVESCATGGGHLRRCDMEAYRTEIRQPLIRDYREGRLLTNPPPSAGGSLLSYSLALMSRFKPERFRLGSAAWMRWMAEVQGWTNRARTQHMDEIRHDAKAIEAFLADHGSSFGEKLWQEVDRWGSTTHISTWDTEGNTASITTSVGQGAGYLIPGTDIMINNMLGEADLNPDGFHRWKPDTRISSMMSPSIYEQKQEGHFKPALVLGTGGANRIRTAILQVLHARIDHGLPIEEAVLAPRMHMEGDSLEMEGGFDLDEIEALPRHEAYSVRSWTDRNMFFGGVHAIALEGDRPLGAADTRRDGAVISV